MAIEYDNFTGRISHSINTDRPSGTMEDGGRTGPRVTENRGGVCQVNEDGSMTYTPADEAREYRISDGFEATSDNVMDTAHSPMGIPQRGAMVTENSLITLPGGIEARIKDAVAAGLLIKHHDGSYTEFGTGRRSAPGVQPQQQQQERQGQDQTAQEGPQEPQQAAQDEPPMESLGEEGDLLVTHLASRVNPITMQRVLEQVAQGKDISQELLEQAAGEGRLPVGDLQALVQVTAGHFLDQAAKSFEGIGLDGRAVLAWARDNAPKALEQAAIMQAQQRSTAGYRKLAAPYTASLEQTNPQALVQAIPPELRPRVVTLGNGKTAVIVDTPHGVKTWSEMVALGWVGGK